MASIRRKRNSKYWFACYTLPSGSRTQRSTKSTDRKAAQKLAETFEEAARNGTTARQAQRIISHIFHQVTGGSLPSATVRSFFSSWLETKKPETKSSTHVFYTAKANRFVNWLQSRADSEISAISSADILAYRSVETERVSPTTVNHEIKILRMIFEQAKRNGLISENPAAEVRRVKRTRENERRPFTLPEIKRLLATADEEWRSLIMFGLYTGQRLGDVARLTWDNIDLQQAEIRLSTAKTGRRQIIPLAAPLLRHIESLPTGDDRGQPIHPRAFKSVTRSGKVGTLSRQFYELMAHTGLVPAKTHRRAVESRGRDGRRATSEISFHALRHTATSLMKNAGISPAIVQDIIGHESVAISANYTHIDDLAKRTALAAMPDVLK